MVGSVKEETMYSFPPVWQLSYLLLFIYHCNCYQSINPPPPPHRITCQVAGGAAAAAAAAAFRMLRMMI